jgi:hypothetical protein
MKLKELAEWYVLIGLSGGFCFFVIPVSCMFATLCPVFKELARYVSDFSLKRADNKVAQAVYSYERWRTKSDAAALELLTSVYPGYGISVDGERVA